ncbi:DegT/DnrJ/EryC1/StrS family aminotransferase [Paenibacillus koleovorans]|uniref:DegT/DnrJ/EryC1/StrS family aminotransferase n=1 Tax=Paenibacillus koleovorans TaxID=121608 RepID=UPI000FD9FC6C|nr:DegT/DnrJ/EryC1/StrS family aminotransferase [Paenibacillus koleovorans]
MNIPLLDLKAQHATIRPEILEAVTRVLDGGHYIMGPEVKQFEEAMARYCGVKYAIGVANGTDALLLVLDALGIGPGDEVITSPFTFFASAEVISQVGARPVFVDIDPNTYNIDVDQLKKAITPRTKAIIPVHIFGQPADLDKIMELAKSQEIAVIEDACQAIGATLNENKVGSIGKAGCFSFFPTKNLGGYGDGGIVVTNDDVLADRIRTLRVHGSKKKYYHDMIGYNSRLDTLQAALLLVKLEKIDDWNQARREKAQYYSESFSSLPIKTPTVKSGREAVFHLYVIESEARDDLQLELTEKGIASGVYYPVPLHLQHVYNDLGYKAGDFPVSEAVSKRVLALPLYPEMTMDQQDYIIDTIANFCAK